MFYPLHAALKRSEKLSTSIIVSSVSSTETVGRGIEQIELAELIVFAHPVKRRLAIKVSLNILNPLYGFKVFLNLNILVL